MSSSIPGELNGASGAQGQARTAPAKLQPRSARQRWDYLVRRMVWNMDIDPTAWISATAYIDRTWPRGIHIGAHCVIGNEASVLTHDMTRGIYLDTRIGARTVIGARAIVMPGVTVGENSLIEPGAVVLRDLPPGSHVGGNPAKPMTDLGVPSATPGHEPTGQAAGV